MSNKSPPDLRKKNNYSEIIFLIIILMALVGLLIASYRYFFVIPTTPGPLTTPGTGPPPTTPGTGPFEDFFKKNAVNTSTKDLQTFFELELELGELEFLITPYGMDGEMDGEILYKKIIYYILLRLYLMREPSLIDYLIILEKDIQKIEVKFEPFGNKLKELIKAGEKAGEEAEAVLNKKEIETLKKRLIELRALEKEISGRKKKNDNVSFQKLNKIEKQIADIDKQIGDMYDMYEKFNEMMDRFLEDSKAICTNYIIAKYSSIYSNNKFDTNKIKEFANEEFEIFKNIDKNIVTQFVTGYYNMILNAIAQLVIKTT